MVTLSSLISQDFPNGASILMEYPSSSNKTVGSVNDEKFLIYDFPSPTSLNIEYLCPTKVCPIAGNTVPLLQNGHPNDALTEHWQQWVPGYVDPIIKPIDVENEQGPIIVSFPHQNIPAIKHAVDPYVHYRLLSKRCIPSMGTCYPKHMTMDDYTLPCMVKAAHGFGALGTFKVETDEELREVLKEMENNLDSAKPPVITEVINDIIGDYCVQFYLFKTGKIHWLGVTRQIIGEGLLWGGGVVDWAEQDYLKTNLNKTIVPVKEYLHKQGYFGIVGIDILTNKHGQYVIDVNPRINGTTPQLLLAPSMAALGYNVSVYHADGEFKSCSDKVLKKINDINYDGEVRVVALSMADVDSHCIAHLVVFAASEKMARKVFEGFKAE